MKQVNVAIIGGGAVGLATAYVLSTTTKHRVIVLEKQSTIVGINQSTRNAGVVHAGIYYPKDREPWKAKLCVEGNAMIAAWCAKYHVPYQPVGKLVVATTPRQEEYLSYILTIAKDNGVPGVTMISGRKAMSMEPNIHATQALYVPSSGLVDPRRLVESYAALSRISGAVCMTGTCVTGIEKHRSAYRLSTLCNGTERTLHADIVINAAGLWSDEVARMIDPDSPYTIDPVRGELAMYPQKEKTRIKRNIYQAPYGYYNETGDQADVPVHEFVSLMKKGVVTRTVGVHLTPTFSNNQISDIVAVGPLKTVGKGKENYSGDTRSSEDYIKKINHFFPSLKKESLSSRYTGIMAVLPNHYDFVIETHKKYDTWINLIGIDSPGLTCSLSIAHTVKSLVG